MKISIDKEVVTIANIKDAKQLINDYSETLDNEMMEILASKASGQSGKLIDCKLKVTKNRYQLTIWAECTLKSFDQYTETHFDVLQADCNETGNIDNFTQIFKLVK